jgi:hypothetical protein
MLGYDSKLSENLSVRALIGCSFDLCRAYLYRTLYPLQALMQQILYLTLAAAPSPARGFYKNESTFGHMQLPIAHYNRVLQASLYFCLIVLTEYDERCSAHMGVRE